jgi:hypothetical protein
MFRSWAACALASFIVLSGCGSESSKPVERLDGIEDVSAFALRSLRGTRDGEQFEVHASYGDGSRSLSIILHFNVTPPARLVSGTWTGLSGGGEVRQRSVTFLGGQAGAPSIGGRFDLAGPDGRPLYRVTIPLQEVKQPLPG